MGLREKIGERLKASRKNASMTLEDVEKVTNATIKKARLNNWEQGRAMPGPEEAKTLGKVFNVSPAYILCLTDLHDRNLKSTIESIPLVSKIANKNLFELKNDSLTKQLYYEQDIIENIPLRRSLSERISQYSFALFLDDNSMSPRANKNDIIIVDPKQKPKPQQYALSYFSINESILFRKYILKKIATDGKEIFELIPLNSDWPNISANDYSDIYIIGTVLEVWSNLSD